MLTRRHFGQNLLLSAGLVFAVAEVSAGTVSERVEFARRRIEDGRRSGALSREEAHRLTEEFMMVRRQESRARADGRLDWRERERLDHELDRLERHISQLKHNDERRGDGRGGPRRY
jgi:polyhydroxyalkanoate synthesis regulator phasin